MGRREPPHGAMENHIFAFRTFQMQDSHVLPPDFKSFIRMRKRIPRAWNALICKVCFWGRFPGGPPGTSPRRHGKSYFRVPYFPNAGCGIHDLGCMPATTRSFFSARGPQGRYQSLWDQRTVFADQFAGNCYLGYSVRAHTIKISPFQPLRSALSEWLARLKIATICHIL